MRKFRGLATLCVSLFLVQCASRTVSHPPLVLEQTGTQKAPRISVSDFFRNVEKTAYQISPDAKHISYLAPYESRLNVFVQRLERDGGPNGNAKLHTAGEPIRLSSVKDRDLAGYFWKGPRTILFMKDDGGDENFHVTSVDIQTKKVRDLTPFPKVKASMLDDLQDISRDEVLIGLNKRNPEIFDIYRLNVRSGKMTMVAENPGGVINWVTDHAGKIRMAVKFDGQNTEILSRATEKEPFKTVIKFGFKDSVTPLFFDFENKAVIASSNLNRDKAAIVKMDPVSGTELEVLYENPDVDVDSAAFSKKRKVLTAALYVTWKLQYHFFDEVSKARHGKIAARFPDHDVSIVSYNKDENTFIVNVWSDRQRGVYYLYDETQDELTKLAETKPWLKEAELAPRKPIEFASRDGLKLRGYLTLPLGVPPRSLPMILLPHGGPWHRDDWGYDAEAQFLANRGYAVLQINFRGSTGYGRKFWEASFKEWGANMQNDLSDAVEWAVSQGVADPKRVGIYGASYGGYATLAGLTFTPELYACGVDYVGISNLFTFMKSIPPYWKPYLERLKAMVGDPETEQVRMRAQSPVFHVERIQAPLFVAQGARDPRVNKAESDQIVESLRKRGVLVEYLVKENEGHGFSNEENRLEFYQKMEVFLEKCLAPRKETVRRWRENRHLWDRR